MLTKYMSRLSKALTALTAFQGSENFEAGDYDRGAELEFYDAAADAASDLLLHLETVAKAKREVRRRYPYAVAMPVEVRESCPPSVRSWHIADIAPDVAHCPLPGDVMPTEDQAWLSCRAALVGGAE